MKVLRFNRNTLQFPKKDFDMVKEGVISLVISGVVIVGLSALWGAPYRAAVTNQEIAQKSPILIERAALGDLDGSGTIASYGPPYNNGWNRQENGVQSIGSFHPQTWWGTPYPIDAAKTDVLTPLHMLANASDNQQLQSALQTYQSASVKQQQTWDSNLSKALKKANVENGNVVIPRGNYGPVALMMNDELSLAKSGMLSGILDRSSNQGVYRWNVQNDLLFLQGKTLHQIAGKINMKGEQWGINHDEQAYPGPWWLTPYTFLYQIPPWSTSSAGDELAAYTIAVLFAILLFVPWIPGLNKLPRLLSIHRLIWRDWYKRLESDNTCANCPLRESCRQEFRNSKQAVVKSGFAPACYQNGSNS
ncbi:hypothetical protein LSG31_07060 [Fodinisporobacter ferrooxydans]|uniref:Cytochrome B6 n=1 Tax=Fodinisporobacter ferrooxydans TaxID=2901836 RepID=A0ABY4CNK6_9BACL|nr:hypothetical protein LSG31_07060 [Alicyclobacillaceae bacterium MYW30-H2]